MSTEPKNIEFGKGMVFVIAALMWLAGFAFLLRWNWKITVAFCVAEIGCKVMKAIKDGDI